MALVGLNAGLNRAWVTFWTPKRRRVYPRIVLVLAIGWSVLFFAYGWNAAARDGRTYGGDFIAYAAAGRLAAEGHPSLAYDDPATYEFERRIGDAGGFVPFHYPPPFLALSRSFAPLHYPLALVLWLAVTGTLFIAVLRLTAHRFSSRDSLLVVPAAIITVGFGQNGFLTAAILGFALVCLDKKPVIAGSLFGLLLYKPQFLPLALLVLLTTGRWRALGAAALSGFGVALISCLVLGMGVWRTYVADLPDAYDVLAETGSWGHMTTLFASLRLLGVPKLLADALSLVLIVSTAVCVVRIWRFRATEATRASSLLVGTLLTTPYAFSYDLTVVAIGAVWFAQETDSLGWRKIDFLSVALVAINPFLFTLVGRTGPFQLGWIPVLLLFAILAARSRHCTPSNLRAAVWVTGPKRSVGVEIPSKLLESRI